MQTSESFRLSAILSFSGGLQDAYTYNVRGQVFANAQTGNVVLMSQNFMEGNVDAGFQYMMPLLAFALGIFIAERVEGSLKENPCACVFRLHRSLRGRTPMLPPSYCLPGLAASGSALQIFPQNSAACALRLQSNLQISRYLLRLTV